MALDIFFNILYNANNIIKKRAKKMKSVKLFFNIFKVRCKRDYERKFGSKDMSLMLAFKEQRLRNEATQKT